MGLSGAYKKREVQLWNSRGALLHIYGGGYALAFSPDGKVLAVACKDGTLRLCDALTGRFLRALHLSGAAGKLCFSPDSRLLAFNIDSNTPFLEVWDARTGKRLRREENSGAQLNIFLPDSRWLIEYNRDSLQVTNARTGQKSPARDQLFHLAQSDNVSFSPDGKTFVTQDLNKNYWVQTVTVRDVRSGRKIVAFHSPPLKDYNLSNGVRVYFSPDSQHLAIVWQPNINVQTPRGAVQLCDLRRRRIVAMLINKTRSFEGPAPSVAWTLAGRYAATWGGYTRGTLELRETASGRLCKTLQGASQSFENVAIAPDSRTLAAGDQSGHLNLWKIR